jgi:hypothetical protein
MNGGYKRLVWIKLVDTPEVFAWLEWIKRWTRSEGCEKW